MMIIIICRWSLEWKRNNLQCWWLTVNSSTWNWNTQYTYTDTKRRTFVTYSIAIKYVWLYIYSHLDKCFHFATIQIESYNSIRFMWYGLWLMKWFHRIIRISISHKFLSIFFCRRCRRCFCFLFIRFSIYLCSSLYE